MVTSTDGAAPLDPLRSSELTEQAEGATHPEGVLGHHSAHIIDRATAPTTPTVPTTTTGDGPVGAGVIHATHDETLNEGSLRESHVSAAALARLFESDGSTLSSKEKEASHFCSEMMVCGNRQYQGSSAANASNQVVMVMTEDLETLRGMIADNPDFQNKAEHARLRDVVDKLSDFRSALESYTADYQVYQDFMLRGDVDCPVKLEDLEAKRAALDEARGDFNTSLGMFNTSGPVPPSDDLRAGLLSARDALLEELKKDEPDEERIKTKLQAFNEELKANPHFLTYQEKGVVWDAVESLHSRTENVELKELTDVSIEIMQVPFNPLASLTHEGAKAADALNDLAAKMTMTGVPPALPESRDEFEKKREGAHLLLKYAFANGSLNKRVRADKSSIPDTTAAFLSRYTHLTKRYAEYREVHAKFMDIKNKIESGQELKDSEKMTPHEARLISSYSKLLPQLRALKKLQVETEESKEIERMASEIASVMDGITHQGWEEASVVVYHGDEERDYGENVGSVYSTELRLTKLFTRGPEAHGAVLYHNPGEKLRLSHILGGYCNNTLEMTAESYAKAYTVNVAGLMSDAAIAKAKAVYGEEAWEGAVKAIWDEAKRELQSEQRFKENRGDVEIKNSTPRRVKSAFASHKKSHTSSYHEEMDIPVEKDRQICSEYTARSMVVTANRFNAKLIQKLNADIEERRLEVAPFAAGERAAKFPISEKERMSAINPAYLIHKWGRPSRKEKSDPLYRPQIFTAVPPGDYAKYFHVPS